MGRPGLDELGHDVELVADVSGVAGLGELGGFCELSAAAALAPTTSMLVPVWAMSALSSGSRLYTCSSSR